MEETERSLHDAIMIVRRAIKNDAVVAGGGAIEMEISKYLRDCSRSVAGKEQLIIAAMAKGKLAFSDVFGKSLMSLVLYQSDYTRT